MCSAHAAQHLVASLNAQILATVLTIGHGGQTKTWLLATGSVIFSTGRYKAGVSHDDPPYKHMDINALARSSASFADQFCRPPSTLCRHVMLCIAMSFFQGSEHWSCSPLRGVFAQLRVRLDGRVSMSDDVETNEEPRMQCTKLPRNGKGWTT